jgi:hypothetical protein
MSDSPSWAGAATAAFVAIGFLAQICLTLVQSRVAARKVAEVKSDLKISDARTATKLDDIHTLVNANMGAQLKISSVALRRVADLTEHPEDEAAAVVAERLLAEHENKQAVVDSSARAQT